MINMVEKETIMHFETWKGLDNLANLKVKQTKKHITLKILKHFYDWPIQMMN